MFCPAYLVDELVIVFYAPFGLMVVLLMLLSHMVSMVLVLLEVGAILGNGYGIQGQSYVALFWGSAVPAGFHYRNLILGICFQLLMMNVFQWCNG